MKLKFKISLMDNGMHSFNKGLEELLFYEESDSKDDFKLKEAILFLHHGIELILKQILINNCGEHLIFDNIGSDTVKKIIEAKKKGISVFNLTKPVHTVSYLVVIQRIKAFVDTVELSESLETKLIELNSIRNNIEHYGIDTEKDKVENLLLKLNKPISNFFHEAGINVTDYKRNWEELEKQLLIETSRLRAGGNIKKAEISEGNALIEYVKDFEEYKTLQPQSIVTKERLESYWESGDAIIKALNDGGLRLLRKLDFLSQVKIILPYKRNIYSIELKRSEVESFLGIELNKVKDCWDDTLNNQYVYSGKERKEFFKRFGKIEKKN